MTINDDHFLNTAHKQKDTPIVPSDLCVSEVTLRVIIIGVVLTILLAAANAYLGLKLGTTISASIPAAVVSMGILRFFRHSTILENTMVQTMASVGESLTAGISFILPALLILHVWDKFHYWQTVCVGLLGGILGVLFTIPLRRALLEDNTLRYPEGTAIGNVLKANVQSTNVSYQESDLKSLSTGGFVGAIMTLCQSGFQILSDHVQYWFFYANTVFGWGVGLSPALIAAGYIVGINVALSLLLGIFIGWFTGVPLIALVYGLPHVPGDAAQMAHYLWEMHIRYIGVGTMLLGGLWTLCTLLKPIVRSLLTSLHSLRLAYIQRVHRLIPTAVPRIERDIPIYYVLLGTGLLSIPIFILIAYFVIPEHSVITPLWRYLMACTSALYILIGGFIFCSVTAYFAGLIGSTNSPVSGLLVSALLVFSLICIALFNTHAAQQAMQHSNLIGIMITIFSAVIIGAALSIANDTMQDLKVGAIVGATPWKQQCMLIAGVVVTAFVIPPILQLLYNAYGIGGVFPRAGMDKAQMLSAPQAGLMATVVTGAFNHALAWGMIIVGMIIALICIILDELLKLKNMRLPVLAVGLGIYLPLDSSMPCVIGGVLAYLIHKKFAMFKLRYPLISDHYLFTNHDEFVSRRTHRGLLLACGIVTGSSLMGVFLAIPFVLKQSADALRIIPLQYESYANLLGLVAAIFLCVWIYRRVSNV